jgi:hypothetical protein
VILAQRWLARHTQPRPRRKAPVYMGHGESEMSYFVQWNALAIRHLVGKTSLDDFDPWQTTVVRPLVLRSE